ncbi:MAG: hypothetical protein S4CHLAM7_06930 [Chlamydiae bacterium]|nr:hypothetical protein [Chlamydiota bacterium]
MNIWALADLHLSLSCPDKTMEVFGETWSKYMERIQENWHRSVQPEDLVLLPGDITWANTLEQATKDLLWIDQLPGKKIMIRGNHDYWWQSLGKVKKILPKSIFAIQNDALNLDNISIGGSRLWDSPDFNSSEIIDFKPNPKANPKTIVPTSEDNEKIFKRELHRLELSLKQMDQNARLKIVMTHYPPITYDLKTTLVHELLLDFKINICVFGHIHNIISTPPPLFGDKDGISYFLVAADYLKFEPLKIESL